MIKFNDGRIDTRPAVTMEYTRQIDSWQHNVVVKNPDGSFSLVAIEKHWREWSDSLWDSETLADYEIDAPELQEEYRVWQLLKYSTSKSLLKAGDKVEVVSGRKHKGKVGYFIQHKQIKIAMGYKTQVLDYVLIQGDKEIIQVQLFNIKFIK
jgi:hypothetical protein